MGEFGARTTGYRTQGGIQVRRVTETIAGETAVERVIDALDDHLGALLASGYEYPGRYTRWDIGFVNPPLQLAARGRTVWLRALNARGEVVLPALERAIAAIDAVEHVASDGPGTLTVVIRASEEHFSEEERSRQPSVFSVIRAVVDLFHAREDEHHGLYGAFGYDLAFQFEPIEQRIERPVNQRDLVLFLPDELVVVDHTREWALRHRYEFEVEGRTTEGLPRTGPAQPYRGASAVEAARDHEEGEFADLVRRAHEYFRRGDLFEVVAGQTFFEPCAVAPSEVFRRLRERNPAPYSALINMGEAEYLVAASPEMYVRVTGRRVETCPISGTIERGEDAVADADRVVELLTSPKDTAELTMCTDVDRNDKSRVCEPGSVRILGRRQIEVYSKLIHTVDHVEGYLRDGFDALDAFLTHAWAVTVTGAPKLWAMRFLERHERSPRGWYGGALGCVGFNGNLNTGLTLRTVRIKDGVAEIRAGGTLLIDSDPDEEERETEVKAAAFLDAIRRAREAGERRRSRRFAAGAGAGRRILLVDYEDSFVHTLANYMRQTGAEVLTVRGAGAPDRVRDTMDGYRPNLVFLSPGPGTPADFDVDHAIGLALDRDLPIFGVCLGLQAVVEHFGGRLGVLDYPVHGKQSTIEVLGGRVFEGLPRRFSAGRYHSLYAVKSDLPPVLRLTAESDDGLVMGVEHESLPVAAVQFHPESLMTLRRDVGLRLIENVVSAVAPRPQGAQAVT